jgi:hypothetical protein
VHELQERGEEEVFRAMGREGAEGGEERGVVGVGVVFSRLEGLAEQGQRVVVVVGVVDVFMLVVGEEGQEAVHRCSLARFGERQGLSPPPLRWVCDC